MKTKEVREEKAPALSQREELVMELLLKRPAVAMYGLELVRESANRLKRGTVYVTLARMEEKGFVESSEGEPEPGMSGLRRPRYRATGFGQRVFQLTQEARQARQLMPAAVGGAA